MDIDLFGVLARMREKCKVFFCCRMASDVRDIDLIFVEYNSTVMDEGVILF